MISLLECTACGWKGEDDEADEVPICPDCGTGHHKMFRMLKKRDGTLECQKCTWGGEPEKAKWEPECPECGNQYLKEV